MEIKEMLVEDIEKRMSEIETEMVSDGADLESLNAEVDALISRKAEIENRAKEEKELREKVAGMNVKPVDAIETEKRKGENEMIENRMVVDYEWIEENWQKEKGFFTRFGDVFVPKDKLLESAIEDVNNDSYVKNEFVEKALDLIEQQPQLQEVFLQWFYKDYEKE